MQEMTENAPVVVKDDTGLAILKAQLDSAERELNTFKEARQDKIKGKENYKEQSDLAARVRKLQLENFEMNDSQKKWKFELLPEYWELQKKITEFKHRQEEALDQGTLSRFDFELAEIDAAIVRNEQKVADLKKQLGV